MRRADAARAADALRRQVAEIGLTNGRAPAELITKWIDAEATVAKIRMAAPPNPEAQDAAPWMRGPTCPECHQPALPMYAARLRFEVTAAAQLESDGRVTLDFDDARRVLMTAIADAAAGIDTILPLWCDACGVGLDGTDEQIEVAREAWTAWEQYVHGRGGR